jgi:hypothetical protein
MGMGTALLVFSPDGMSFEEYFALDGYEFEDQILKFIVGVSPSMLQRHYLLNRESVNLFKKKVPSTALKLLLGRGGVRVAPKGLHFDAYQNRLVKTWRPFGNRNPLQQLMFHYIRGLLRKSA